MNAKEQIIKYPRTKHIEGSNESIGDDMEKVPFSSIKDKYLVIEEKMEGANCGVSFSSAADFLLQSRGHYLTGGWRERHFNYLKHLTSSALVYNTLLDTLEDHYIMYGEWLYAKHTLFYDRLPCYFMEFDIYDKYENMFLNTDRRHELLKNVYTCFNVFQPVRVIFRGKVGSYEELIKMVTHSAFISNSPKESFLLSCNKTNDVDIELELEQTDLSGIMEGLYIKVEEDGIVKDRYKWVRSSFTQKVLDSESHWQSRPIIKNLLTNCSIN